MHDSLSTSYLFIHLHTSFPPHTKRQLVDKMHILLRPSPKLSARPLYPPYCCIPLFLYIFIFADRPPFVAFLQPSELHYLLVSRMFRIFSYR
ncbi:hypothetical protein M413DRAFT_317272 [Hebeloma cylindrosporum]|uniref:Uncharacterized protein n=1 Tax=Hebeloma cylindrosporum TaxID=76867 RepID=A0A0C3CR07_HEBCY|nr:hypothetical protein M413DRAFT_317272 [Hebeloma cylindrosporum h7]